MGDATGRVLLVTGAGRGIGATVARLAAERGYSLAINYSRSKVEAEETAQACRAFGVEAETFQADIGNSASIPPLFDAVIERFGRLDALVNNAGMTGLASPLADADDQTIIDTINLNTTGLILCTKAAILHMAYSRGGQGGAIVNLSSGATTIGSPGEFTWYAGSKGAVDSFTLGIAKETAADGVRINAVSPGLIDTDIHASAGKPDRVKNLTSQIPIKRPGSNEEVARPILFLLSDEASYVTGATLRVAGGR